MEVDKNKIFNLWNTNGRRSDVINALEIYLSILHNLWSQYPSEKWESYPKSTIQYRFYKAAIEASPDVFQGHPNFDNFECFLQTSDNYEKFVSRTLNLDDKVKKNLDANIEQRARHYTSNLERWGFTNKERIISTVGRDMLSGNVERDSLEKLLPITDINLLLLRQLLKLRIYTTPNENGDRIYYSPCLCALYLLLNNDNIGINDFKQQIQGVSPYWKDSVIFREHQITNILQLLIDETVIPELFLSNSKITERNFRVYIKNRKSNSTIPVYYTFYSALFDYVQQPDENNFLTLRNVLLGKDSDKLKKAFGFGKEILKCGNKNHPYNHSSFIEKNSDNPLLSNNINREFYKNYNVSKLLDIIDEYSDTTIRMLGATGLFQFSKPLVELSHKKFLKVLLSRSNLQESIFGIVTNNEYERMQTLYYESVSISSILGFDSETIKTIISDLQRVYGVSKDIHSALVNENNTKLERHIQEKYPKEKIVELLRYITTRQKDKEIKRYVNDDATIPTIYEYIVAIAWYYISGKKISVYDSLNLTLNGDFEPVIHAGGGAGDIVVKYTDKIVMLEATLMNAAAQKRGEWEPVLRHAINLTADSYPKKVFTLFVADTLDYNTINIWRAVAAVTLKSSSTGEKTEHVIIMPFTNENICQFIEGGISDDKIITAVDNSYDEIKANFDDTWHNKIIASLK